MLTRLLIRSLYHRADQVVSVSDGVGLDAIQQGFVSNRCVRTIYNPVNRERIDRMAGEPFPEACQFLQEDPALINVGRMSRQKGQEHLLRVFARVKRLKPDCRLMILGDGHLRASLLTRAKQLGLDSCEVHQEPEAHHDVLFMGYRENPYQFIRAADTFVLTSHWEGLPNVLLESMVCGTPVISADCRYGPRELLAPSTDVRRCTDQPEEAEHGILMPEFRTASDPSSDDRRYGLWSRTVTRLLCDEERRRVYAGKGRQRAKAFERERIFGQWRDLLDTLQQGAL
jgi:glycosyltransferase involved in cell wall biosynthesis